MFKRNGPKGSFNKKFNTKEWRYEGSIITIGGKKKTKNIDQTGRWTHMYTKGKKTVSRKLKIENSIWMHNQSEDHPRRMNFRFTKKKKFLHQMWHLPCCKLSGKISMIWDNSLSFIRRPIPNKIVFTINWIKPCQAMILIFKKCQFNITTPLKLSKKIL